MKKCLAIMLAVFGAGLLAATLIDLCKSGGTLMLEARAASPVPHWVFLEILVWTSLSVWAGVTIYIREDDQ